MKYLLSIILILGTSVTFGYYLFSNPNFLPLNDLGEYNWINIFTLLFLVSLILFSFFNLLIYSIQTLLERRINKKKEKEEEQNKQLEEEELIRKENEKKERVVRAVKTSFLLTIGVLTVFSLNFFHILNWIWGISILLVVLIFTFII